MEFFFQLRLTAARGVESSEKPRYLLPIIGFLAVSIYYLSSDFALFDV